MAVQEEMLFAGGYRPARGELGKPPIGGSAVSRGPVEVAPALYAALVEAKREMWMSARHQWNLSDFNNWAVIQQINAALTLADGKPRP